MSDLPDLDHRTIRDSGLRPSAVTAAQTAPDRGVLAGIGVLDSSRVLAGPYATQLPGDHGAEVVKIESWPG